MSARTINDPVFGVLIGEDGQWEKQDLVPFLGYDVEVTVTCGDGAEPDDQHRARFLEFLEKRDQFKAELESAIFSFYQDIYEDYQVIWDEVDEDAAEKNAPTLTSSIEIWKLIKPHSITIPPQSASDVERSNEDFSIWWWTTWDIEHELLTECRDWKVTSMDMQ
jgi:hypothetical protein